MRVAFDGTDGSFSVSALSCPVNGTFFSPAVWNAPVSTAILPPGCAASHSLITRRMNASRREFCGSFPERLRSSAP